MRLQLKSSVIRPFDRRDATSLQRYANNRAIWMHVRDIFPHPYRLEDAEAFLKFVEPQNPLVTFAIANESEAIGCIGLRLGEDVHRRTAELGYWLGEPYWGKGIMTEAVIQFTNHAFALFDLDRIYAEPFSSNPASARVLEKAGFLCEGRLRANVFKDGRTLDSLLYARLRGNSPA